MEDCLLNRHSFVEVNTSQDFHGTASVVRWCIRCGAIKVDLDYDDGIIEGAVFPLTLPRYIWLIKEEEKEKEKELDIPDI